MGRLSGWKTACFIFTLWAATGIASPAQTFTNLVTFDDHERSLPVRSSCPGIRREFLRDNGGRQRKESVLPGAVERFLKLLPRAR